MNKFKKQTGKHIKKTTQKHQNISNNHKNSKLVGTSDFVESDSLADKVGRLRLIREALRNYDPTGSGYISAKDLEALLGWVSMVKDFPKEQMKRCTQKDRRVRSVSLFIDIMRLLHGMPSRSFKGGSNRCLRSCIIVYAWCCLHRLLLCKTATEPPWQAVFKELAVSARDLVSCMRASPMSECLHLGAQPLLPGGFAAFMALFDSHLQAFLQAKAATTEQAL